MKLTFEELVQHNQKQPGYKKLLKSMVSAKMGKVDSFVRQRLKSHNKQYTFEDGLIGCCVAVQNGTFDELYNIPLTKHMVGIRIIKGDAVQG